MEDNIEDNIESIVDKDALKKDLEIQKLQKELVKIDRESKESLWRRRTTLISTIFAFITISVTLYKTWNSDLFEILDNRLKLERENLDSRKDALSLSVKKLKADSIQLKKELKNAKNELKNAKNEINNLDKNFKIKETRYKDLLTKNEYQIKKQEYQIKKNEAIIDSLGKEIIKAEDCYSTAKELLMICVQNVYDEASKGYTYMSLNQRKKYPLKTRLRKTDNEIAEMDLSNMNTIQFLTEIAYFEVKNELSQDKTMIVSKSLVSKDGAINITFFTLKPGPLRKKDTYEPNDRRDIQFGCWKSLSKNQKLKLLKEIKVRE